MRVFSGDDAREIRALFSSTNEAMLVRRRASGLSKTLIEAMYWTDESRPLRKGELCLGFSLRIPSDCSRNASNAGICSASALVIDCDHPTLQSPAVRFCCVAAAARRSLPRKCRAAAGLSLGQRPGFWRALTRGCWIVDVKPKTHAPSPTRGQCRSANGIAP